VNLALLERAIAAVPTTCGDRLPDRVRNRKRSCAWVECLAAELRARFEGSAGDIRVFSKEYRKNRKEFGVNEMLYDIGVCETATCPSHTGRKQLRYITHALWLIESEFAKNSAAAVNDFNKLVLGAADNKLFIAPFLGHETRDKNYREKLLPVAQRCLNPASRNVYLAQVPHPNRWGERPPHRIGLWKLEGLKWAATEL
jgi:hypothetical protein